MPDYRRPSQLMNHAQRIEDTLRLVARLNALIDMNCTVLAFTSDDSALLWVPIKRFYYTEGDFFTAESTVEGYGPFGYGIHHNHNFRISTLDCQYEDCIGCDDIS